MGDRARSLHVLEFAKNYHHHPLVSETVVCKLHNSGCDEHFLYLLAVQILGESYHLLLYKCIIEGNN